MERVLSTLSAPPSLPMTCLPTPTWSLTMRCVSTPTLWLPLRSRRSSRGTRRGARCWCCRRCQCGVCRRRRCGCRYAHGEADSARAWGTLLVPPSLTMRCVLTPTLWPPLRTRRSRRGTRVGHDAGAADVANEVLVDADVLAAATYTAEQTRHASGARCWCRRR